jgi:hypothetical protein
MTWIIGLACLGLFAGLLMVIGWIIGTGERQVFHRPDPTTDCPTVEIKENDDVRLG